MIGAERSGGPCPGLERKGGAGTGRQDSLGTSPGWGSTRCPLPKGPSSKEEAAGAVVGGDTTVGRSPELSQAVITHRQESQQPHSKEHRWRGPYSVPAGQGLTLCLQGRASEEPAAPAGPSCTGQEHWEAEWAPPKGRRRGTCLGGSSWDRHRGCTGTAGKPRGRASMPSWLPWTTRTPHHLPPVSMTTSSPGCC